VIAPSALAPVQREWTERPVGDHSTEIAAPTRSLELIRASELEVRPVSWLWPERVPIGALTVLAGEPGLGKSLMSINLAARLSRGELGGTAGATLFLTAEDAREQVVLPRLVAARADLDRIVFPPRGRDSFDETIRLPDDVARLGELVATAGVKLIVIDPLVAHLPAKVNSWQVRGALAPLAALAEEQEAAVLLIAHLNKGQGSDPLRRLGGSIDCPPRHEVFFCSPVTQTINKERQAAVESSRM
jgi:RecA-family ATPase